MYLLGKRADKLNADDIIRLVQNKVQENKSLDYKRELKLSQDKDKKEFLFDITSMSNTDGGCFIFGIEENKDEKGQNTGTPEKIVGIHIENYDKLSQQIEDIVRGNTEPSISNIALNALVVEGQNILVVGVSKTLGLPTMVTFHESSKFYRRRNSGKYSVDVYELNQMFMQNQVLKESAEKFKLQRIEKVRAGKVFPNLETDTSFFIHIIPFGFQNDLSLDLTHVENMDLSGLMQPLYTSGWDRMFNIDGYATWTGKRPKITSYNQIFRNGIYEIYTAGMFVRENLPNGESQLRMFGNTFISEIIEKIKNGLTVLQKFQIEPPFIISISLLGVQDGVIYYGPRYTRPFMTNEIYIPSTIITNLESDIYEKLKPCFDILWQCVSENQSPPLKS